MLKDYHVCCYRMSEEEGASQMVWSRVVEVGGVSQTGQGLTEKTVGGPRGRSQHRALTTMAMKRSCMEPSTLSCFLFL